MFSVVPVVNFEKVWVSMGVAVPKRRSQPGFLVNNEERTTTKQGGWRAKGKAKRHEICSRRVLSSSSLSLLLGRDQFQKSV